MECGLHGADTKHLYAPCRRPSPNLNAPAKSKPDGIASLLILSNWYLGQSWKRVAPFYGDTAGRRGRSAIGLSRMYVVQQRSGFFGEGTEDAIYESQVIRSFMGIDLGREFAPYPSCVFRRLLEPPSAGASG
ncbi:hypothetical protein EMIT0324P_170069 [Pseudomonas chlororaphis]